MKSSLKHLFIFTVLLAGTSTTVSASMDEAALVDQILANYRQAWLAGDQEAVLATLSDDIELFIPGSTGGKLNGKQAVREFWFPESEVSYPIRGYEVSEQGIYAEGEMAVVTGRSKLDWETVDSGKVIDQATSHSEFITVLRKEGEHWRIFRQMYQMRQK
jgi:ketosteroid isomerase-like protein